MVELLVVKGSRKEKVQCRLSHRVISETAVAMAILTTTRRLWRGCVNIKSFTNFPPSSLSLLPTTPLPVKAFCDFRPRLSLSPCLPLLDGAPFTKAREASSTCVGLKSEESVSIRDSSPMPPVPSSLFVNRVKAPEFCTISSARTQLLVTARR